MSPRKRSSKKAGWPRNLYEHRGYYTWRHPKTRETFGLGRDRARAFTEAMEANIKIAGLSRVERLVDRLDGPKRRDVASWFAKYDELLAKRELAANTRRSYKSLCKRAVRMLGADSRLKSVTALQVTEVLDELAATGKERTAQALASFLRESFRSAIVQGWLDENPVRAVKASPVKVRRARMTLEIFRAAYKAADPWLRNAMALALVAAQRREDVAAARFADVREGCWWVEQGKTGAKVAIPLELRLDAFGMSLKDVIAQCRGTGVLSRHLVHQTSTRGNSPAGRQIFKDTISKRFKHAMDSLGLAWGDKQSPTFHEIRSLSARLYKAQGGVNTQGLLGHRSPETTQLYQDERGGWVRLKVGTV